jgi:hypothetical protein
MRPAHSTEPLVENPMIPGSLLLTPNDSTSHTWIRLDLPNGTLVPEVPPKVLGDIDDMRYSWVRDVDLHWAGQGAASTSGASTRPGAGEDRASVGPSRP